MFASRTGWNLKKNRYAEELETLRRSGTAMLDLTASNPTVCGFEFNEQEILESLRSRESLVYHPEPRGLITAREAIARYYGEHAKNAGTGPAISADDIFLTTGTSEAYSFLFRLLCNAGDQVLVPRPSYPLFDFLADIQDVRLVPYPLQYDHGWHIDFPALRSSITESTRAIMVVHPNNPTGSFAGRDAMQQLTKLCAEHDVALIADEVFLDYTLPGVAARSFAFDSSCLTFVLSGLSKVSCLPQMKLGWMVVSGPPGLRGPAEERLEVIADTYLSMNAPLQLALPKLLEQRRHMQPQLSARIQRNLAALDQALQSQPTVSRLVIEGGWYAVLRVPAIHTDEELVIDLMRKQLVLIHPGHFYDFPREGYLVMSLITPEEEFAEGVRRLLLFQNGR